MVSESLSGTGPHSRYLNRFGSRQDTSFLIVNVPVVQSSVSRVAAGVDVSVIVWHTTEVPSLSGFLVSWSRSFTDLPSSLTGIETVPPTDLLRSWRDPSLL